MATDTLITATATMPMIMAITGMVMDLHMLVGRRHREGTVGLVLVQTWRHLQDAPRGAHPCAPTACQVQAVMAPLQLRDNHRHDQVMWQHQAAMAGLQ